MHDVRPGGTCLDVTLAYIDARRDNSATPPEAFSLYAGLFTIQQKYYDRFTPPTSAGSPDVATGRVALDAPDLPTESVRDAVTEVAAALSEAAPERAEEIASLTAAILDDERNLCRPSDCRSSLSGPRRDLLLLALNPFYEKLASQTIPSITDLHWRFPYCPVCGEYALAGKLVLDSGRRLLQCCLCRTQWFRPGTVCAFCDNTDPDKRAYLSRSSDSAYRAEICDVCSCYIKIADERAMEREAILHVDAFALADLDREATARGYHPWPHSNSKEGNQWD